MILDYEAFLCIGERARLAAQACAGYFMAKKREISRFVNAQQTLQFYPKVRKALTDVLCGMPDEDYKQATKNLYLMVLHEGALGQVMHFPSPGGRFKIVQLSFAKKAPLPVMRYVIAHELGHAMQRRNWRRSDRSRRLEIDADRWASKWGFPPTKSVLEAMGKCSAALLAVYQVRFRR